MNFEYPAHIQDFRMRVREFVAQHILPLESSRANYDEYENISAPALASVRAKVKAAGLWAPQMPKEMGGQGLSMIGMTACYPEMNRSIFGPICFNAAAPDDGTMIALNKVLPAHRKGRWLQPIIDGDVQSAFAMTEPAPGSGSDPTMMRTTATKKGDRWVINGRKWFITGAGLAKHFILIARTSDDPRRGLTAFLYHADQPGWRIERRIPLMGAEDHGGHCEITYDGLEIPDEDVILDVGDGLKFTQIRLGPARLTHCMRWTGLARRALDIATEYVKERSSQGLKLADHEGVQWMLGEAAMQVDIAWLVTQRAAAKIDTGDFARKEVSLAKIVASEALNMAADTAIQLCGARGYSKDLPLEWIYRYARVARLGDGPSEVHKMVLSKLLLADSDKFWS